MKYLLAITLGALGGWYIATYRDAQESADWQAFRVAHSCRVVQSKLDERGRVVYRCDNRIHYVVMENTK